MANKTSMKHTVSTWFTDGQTVYEYFNTSFQRNTMGTLKFPASIVRKFTENDGTVDVNKITNTMAQRAIDTIVKKKFILTSVEFEWLLPEHREMLREAVCSAMQDAVLNNNVNERSSGSSVSTSSFTVSQDPAGWMFTYDSFGTRTKELVELANLDKYKIVGDTFLGQALYTNKNKGTVIVHEWNNLEFGKDLSSEPRNDLLSFEVSHLTGVNKYDYVYLSDGSLWRFEGGISSDVANWDRKDNVSIGGNRYLVYKDYLLVGEKGKDGEDGKDGSDGKDLNILGHETNIATVIAKPDPKKDDVWIVGGDMIIYNGYKWVNGGPIAVATVSSQWRTVNKEGRIAIQPAHGEIVLLEDASGRPIVSNLDNAAATQGYVLARTDADDFEKLVKVDPITISSGDAVGGHLSYQEHYGNLDTLVERQNFMSNVTIGKWYTFNVNNEGYQALVYSGASTTSYLWIGFKEFVGPNGQSIEIVKGITTEIGNAIQAAPAIGEFFANTVAQPVSYGALQMLPKDVIIQLINDMMAPTITDTSDPTWSDAAGSQTMTFNPAQISITWTGSGILANENVQLILGSTAGDLVLNEAIHVYPDVATASANGYVSGKYKWYMYISGAATVFVMEDSSGSLTDTSQAVSKIRRTAPRVQPMTAHYTTQQDILLNSTWIGELIKGTSKTVTLPTGITTDNLGQIGLSVSGTTDWETVSGWDKVTPFYISVTTEDTTNTWWIEYKVEAVPGDKTKLKITNFISGNQNNKTQAYKAHWIHFKGGR